MDTTGEKSLSDYMKQNYSVLLRRHKPEIKRHRNIKNKIMSKNKSDRYKPKEGFRGINT